MRVFEFGFQFHTPSKKENILSEKFSLVKIHVFSQKSQRSSMNKPRIFAKSLNWRIQISKRANLA